MKISRRAFAKRAGAFALLSNLRCFGGGTQPPRPFNDITEFHLFFHGLWTFIVDDGGITAITPLTCEHCYVAGSLAANPLLFPPGSIALSGVTSGSDTFNPQYNLILPTPAGINLDGDFRNQVSFPVPQTIRSRRQNKIGFSELASPRTMSMVQQFIYNVAPLNPVLTGLSGWTPQPASGVVNIHFYAEPPDHVQPSHAAMAMNDMCFKDRLQLHVTSVPANPTPTAVPEEYTLRERTVTCTPDCLFTDSVLARVGETKKRVTHKPSDKDDRGPDVANCMSLILD